MTKLDLKKDLKHLYHASTTTVTQVDVPPLNFLKIDGAGDPNSAPAYGDAITALYGVAYALKFASKAQGIDFVVMPLEGLWWADDMAAFRMDDKSNWQWTAMIMQPEHITPAMVTAAVDAVRRKKNPPALDKLRFEPYHEGLAAQIMHIGPYADEAPTIERLHTWILENGYTYHGAHHHHEIYLSDPNRTAPEKLKTVIRQPMLKKDT